jgi:hypothetical protein
MTPQEARQAVKNMLPNIPKTTCGRTEYGQTLHRRILTPLAEVRKYRKKNRHIVGYTWTRPYSHHMSGMTYDAVMGYGETWDDAIAMMKAKLPC